jgi:hypothetical protein
MQSNMAKELLVTPLGELKWAKVFEPEDPRDEGKSRVWSTDLVLDNDSPECLALMTRIEELQQTANGAGAKIDKKGWPFKDEVDQNDQPTGRTVFRFKRNETSKKGNSISPPVIVDAKRKTWPADDLIGNGSKGKVAYSFYGWDSPTTRGAKGLSLWLEMVQVIDFVPYQRASAQDAFEEEEGYEAEVATPTPFAEEVAKPAPAAALTPSQRLQQRAQQVAAEAADGFEEEVPF